MPTFAQRCQSATSRSSCTFGISARLRRLQPVHDLFVVTPRRQRRHAGRARRAGRAARARRPSARDRRASTSGSIRPTSCCRRRARRVARAPVLFLRRGVAGGDACLGRGKARRRASGPPSSRSADSPSTRAAPSPTAACRRRDPRRRPRFRGSATSSARRAPRRSASLPRALRRRRRPVRARPRPARRGVSAAASCLSVERLSAWAARARSASAARFGVFARGPFGGLRGRGGVARPARAASASAAAAAASCAARSSLSRSMPRARFDALLFFARAAICSSVAAIGEAIDRRERRVLELAVQRDARGSRRDPADARTRAAAPTRAPACRAIDPSACAFGHARRARARRSFRATRSWRSPTSVFASVERVDRRDAFRFADALERLERDVAQHRRRLRPHALVRVVSRDRGQRRRIHQLGDRRAAHARVLVLARDLGEQLALVDRNLLDERQADRGVRVLVPGLRAETIEQWPS